MTLKKQKYDLLHGSKRYKVVPERKKGCEKNSYSKKEAQTIINKNKKESKKFRKEIRYYHCDKCNLYHLTSKELFVD
mgnify:FL=1